MPDHNYDYLGVNYSDDDYYDEAERTGYLTRVLIKLAIIVAVFAAAIWFGAQVAKGAHVARQAPEIEEATDA